MRRIVITGLGVISPLGNSVDAFWNALQNGTSGIGLIDRFDTSEFKAKVAAQVRDFDALRYFQDKGEVSKTDLFAQYAVAAAEEAMADSGLKDATIDSERFGVYVGSGIGGIATFAEQTTRLVERGPSRVSPHFIPKMIGNMASGLIAIRFGAHGVTLPVVTACATGSHAIGEAYHAILHGYADVILAGGAEAAITPLAVAGFTSCMALSKAEDPSRASIPFDRERSGFVMGEGAGILVVEEYEHAKQRGAHIYAEICGYGNTCDAHHVTAPDPEALGAARAVTQAMREAGMTGDEAIYVNAHGTGTPMNDKVETLALKKAFGDKAYKLLISSTKSMTGHMLGAAGAVEAMACALALRDGVVPPTINYRVPDEDCDLDYVPNEARRADIDYALSTSLGFGGHNACLALKKFAE